MSKSKLSVLAGTLSEKSGLSVEEAEKFIKQMFDVANDALQQDKIVKMKWLGTFKVLSVKDRESIDVNTGERILIEGRDKISFTPDNVLKEIVNKPFAQFETVVVNDGVDFSAIDEKFAKMEAEEKETILLESKSPILQEETTSQVQDESSSQEINNSVNDVETPVSNVICETSTVEEPSEAEEISTSGDASTSEETSSAMNASSEVLVFGDDENEPQNPGITDEVVVISDQNGVITVSSDSTSFPKEKEEASVIIVGETVSEEKVSHERTMISSEESRESSEESTGGTDVPEGNPNDAKEESDGLKEDIAHLEEDIAAPIEESEEVSEEESEEVSEEESEKEFVEESEKESEEECSRHFVIPKYMLAIAGAVFVALVGGGCWFAFNYGKVYALKDQLALQANSSQDKPVAKQSARKPTANQDSTQLILQQKAKQDSIRLAEANKAVKMAEEAAEAARKQDEKAQVEETAITATKVKIDKAKADKNKADKAKGNKAKENKAAKDDAVAKSGKYDGDPRVRTGAYRIIGVAQTVTVKPGQTLAGISKTYLGAGMECYVEAINGSSEVKAGQKLKIPKLELKKKSQAKK